MLQFFLIFTISTFSKKEMIASLELFIFFTLQSYCPKYIMQYSGKLWLLSRSYRVIVTYSTRCSTSYINSSFNTSIMRSFHWNLWIRAYVSLNVNILFSWTWKPPPQKKERKQASSFFLTAHLKSVKLSIQSISFNVDSYWGGSVEGRSSLRQWLQPTDSSNLNCRMVGQFYYLQGNAPFLTIRLVKES